MDVDKTDNIDATGDEERRYRVLLLGIGDNTEEKKISFCNTISETYGIPFPMLRRMTENFPTVLKKNLTFDKAVTLAKTLKSFGAFSSVEEKRNCPVVSLESQDAGPFQLALESTNLRKAQSGVWILIGRVRNISEESLRDIWVLTQILDEGDEILSFEEVPISINPLLPNEASPFKVIFEEGLSVQRVSLLLKSATGATLPTKDGRKRKEWVEVKWETHDRKDDPCSPLFSVDEMEEFSVGGPTFSKDEMAQSSGLAMPSGSAGEGLPGDSLEETRPPQEVPWDRGVSATFEAPFFEARPPVGRPDEKPSIPMAEEIQKLKDVEKAPSDQKTEPNKVEEPISEMGVTESVQRVAEEAIRMEEASLSFLLPGSVEKEEGEGPSVSSHTIPLAVKRDERFQEGRFDLSIFEEASKLLEEISNKPSLQEKEEYTLFPWINDFRNSVERYYQKNPDPFSSWFNSCRHSEALDDPYRSVLTILGHARFLQKNESDKALENTRRVFRLLGQTDLRLEQIPTLEGTPFFNGETWRELFYRAVAKLQEVANHIIAKKKWNASDLERFIQIIPHMGHRNSRLAIQWMHELIPEVVDIDTSMLLPFISETFYRVSARLGVVDPRFDTFQGKNSIGELKLQSFAKTAFPRSPWKIERPMSWVGIAAEEGGAGYCRPIDPLCGECLFETFCPRLYTDLNPSEGGMRTG